MRSIKLSFALLALFAYSCKSTKKVVSIKEEAVSAVKIDSNRVTAVTLSSVGTKVITTDTKTADKVTTKTETKYAYDTSARKAYPILTTTWTEKATDVAEAIKEVATDSSTSVKIDSAGYAYADTSAVRKEVKTKDVTKTGRGLVNVVGIIVIIAVILFIIYSLYKRFRNAAS